MKKSKLFFIVILQISLSFLLFAETITTAGDFFSTVSEKYDTIRSYTANLNIKTGTGNNAQTMNSIVYFRRPNLLSIEFSRPADQTLLFTGDMLTIYLPQQQVVLTQSVDKAGSTGGAAFASPKGLSMMRRAYTIAYETSATPVPMSEGSSEKVVILAMQRRATSETFRTLRVMIDPSTKLIRRIEATPAAGANITFDFSNYSLNKSIPDNKFYYDMPPSATVLNNFLFLE